MWKILCLYISVAGGHNAAMSKKRGGRKPLSDLKQGEHTPIVNLRVPVGEQEQWKRAAELRGKSMSAWVRAVLSRAARRVIKRDLQNR